MHSTCARRILITSANSAHTYRSELVRRAERQGAADAESQRAFAKADDMYLFGLLSAYMVFVPLSLPGSIDFPTLQRLVEVTFRNDFSGLRCACPTFEFTYFGGAVS
jgi:hypothetical protein